ncbi:MAG: hypothetical protein R2715_25160, partial [Ilumatobacteraceae bacterium]
LAAAGLTERSDLQEWVLRHPEILGDGVRIVTFEFDRWRTASGAPERDRLDVLGLDRDGTLVVGELKRDAAPDTVEMQAIKYAAMTSRFTVESLATAHARFLSRDGDAVSAAEALELLNVHTSFGIDPVALRRPRIVLVAGSFPSIVTATAVWLTEMGVSFTLVKVQAYRTGGPGTHLLVTVSQLYPVREAESFMVGPRPASADAQDAAKEELPVIEWTADDYCRLDMLPPRPTVRAILDLCSNAPGVPVPLRTVEAVGERTTFEARGELAGLTMLVKSRFRRRNWPFTMEWAAGGDKQAYYTMTADQAALWIAATTRAADSSEIAALPSDAPDGQPQ